MEQHSVQSIVSFSRAYGDCDCFGLELVWGSSKTCHHCGHIHKELTLSDRTYNCLNCGTVIDRDLNAALVLSQYGEVNQKTRVGCTQSYACELEGADSPG